MAVITAPAPSQGVRFPQFLEGILLLRESKIGMFGAGLVLFWVVVALISGTLIEFGILFPPNEPLVPNLLPGSNYLLAAGKLMIETPVEDVCSLIASGADAGKYDCGTFWFGTDTVGRDLLSRTMFGARQVLLYAPLAVFCAYAVGIPMGLAAGYLRGWVDDVLSFTANVILSFPVLVLYIIVISVFGASALNIVVAVVFGSAPTVFRIVRGITLDLCNVEYMLAAETRGEPTWRMLLVELLPNARGPLIVDAMLRLGFTVIAIGVLGFLGLGLPPPDPDWGKMVSEMRSFITVYPHMVLFPCIAISSLILGFNLLADGLREISLRD
jgi:ABC-type dipeptide/oligopeptide/nickel transport system permease subunit